MDSFSDKALEKNYFFSNRDLTKLFIPLIIEQGLEFLVGLIASIMVSRVGEAAVSAVSLVEFLMALFISIFAAFATGGGIVAGQYLGDRDSKNANKAVNQLVKFTRKLIVILISLHSQHRLSLFTIRAQRFSEP